MGKRKAAWTLGLLLLAGTAMADTGAVERMQAKFDSVAQGARTWQYGWTSAHLAAAGVQGVMGDVSGSEDERHDARVGAITSGIGVLDMALSPLASAEAAAKFRAFEGTEEERLAYGRSLMAACLASEKSRTSWKAHAGAGLVNLASGIAVGLDDSRWGDAATTFVLGMLVSELQIWSTPVRGADFWTDDSIVARGPHTPKLAVIPGGVMVTVPFD